MKKFLTLTAAVLALSTGAALANHHEGGAHDGKKAQKMEMMFKKHFEKDDTNNDGVISEAEFEAANAERFDKMDANDDGALTMDEIKAHMKEKHEKWKEKRMEKKEMNN